MDKAFQIQVLASVLAQYEIALHVLSEIWGNEFEFDPRMAPSGIEGIQQAIGQHDFELPKFIDWIKHRMGCINEELKRLA